METPLLIAISGVKRSGKDTTASFIEEWAGSLSRPLTVKRRGFADKAKLAFAKQFFPDISMEDAIAWVDEFKFTGNVQIKWTGHVQFEDRLVCNFEGRDVLAQFCTDGARDIYGEDHWVDLLLPTRQYIDENDLPLGPRWHDEFIVDLGKYNTPVADIAVITDERFENENKRVKTLGGINWKVRRKDAEDAVIEEYRSKGKEVHRSELGVPDRMFDRVFINDDNDLNLARQRVFDELDRILILV